MRTTHVCVCAVFVCVCGQRSEISILKHNTYYIWSVGGNGVAAAAVVTMGVRGTSCACLYSRLCVSARICVPIRVDTHTHTYSIQIHSQINTVYIVCTYTHRPSICVNVHALSARDWNRRFPATLARRLRVSRVFTVKGGCAGGGGEVGGGGKLEFKRTRVAWRFSALIRRPRRREAPHTHTHTHVIRSACLCACVFCVCVRVRANANAWQLGATQRTPPPTRTRTPHSHSHNCLGGYFIFRLRFVGVISRWHTVCVCRRPMRILLVFRFARFGVWI